MLASVSTVEMGKRSDKPKTQINIRLSPQQAADLADLRHWIMERGNWIPGIADRNVDSQDTAAVQSDSALAKHLLSEALSSLMTAVNDDRLVDNFAKLIATSATIPDAITAAQQELGVSVEILRAVLGAAKKRCREAYSTTPEQVRSFLNQAESERLLLKYAHLQEEEQQQALDEARARYEAIQAVIAGRASAADQNSSSCCV
jgi:hypothetical protein